MASTRKPLIEKYLGHYAESEAGLLAEYARNWPDKRQFNHALIIPTYKETADFFARLACEPMRRESVLLVVVINQPDSLETPHPDNQVLLEALRSATEHRWHKGNLWLGKLPKTDSAILIVDRFSSLPIPHRQGVGLARKIGADLALALHHHTIVKSPWLCTSDADAILPQRYFSALTDQPVRAAAVFPFTHCGATGALGQVTALYEQRLDQYVRGLAWAGSPYAYHTLGSTIAVRAEAYAKVRGFPKRNAGEDFHLLNKLTKVGHIVSLEAPRIQIQARNSDRVPFGTGPAINQLLKHADPELARIFYHPEVFSQLKSWLEVLPLSRSIDLRDLPLSQQTLHVLESLGTESAIASARKTGKHAETFARHLHNWFDGLKTLRFVHGLQTRGLSNISFRQLKTRTPDPAAQSR